MAAEEDYTYYGKQKQPHCKKWYRHPNMTDIRYRIVQNFGDFNFWWMKLEDAFGR